MSDIPLGPGWWQASDGKWYHPDLHPSVRAAGNPGSGAAPAAEQPGPAAEPPVAERVAADAPAADTPAAQPGSPWVAEPASRRAEPTWPYQAEPSTPPEPGPSDRHGRGPSPGYQADPSPPYGPDPSPAFAGNSTGYAGPASAYAGPPPAYPSYGEPLPGYGQPAPGGPEGPGPAPAGEPGSLLPAATHPAFPAGSAGTDHHWWVSAALVATVGLLLVGASWAISAVASFQTAPSQWFGRLFAVAAAAGWIVVAVAVGMLARSSMARREAPKRR